MVAAFAKKRSYVWIRLWVNIAWSASDLGEKVLVGKKRLGQNRRRGRGSLLLHESCRFCQS